MIRQFKCSWFVPVVGACALLGGAAVAAPITFSTEPGSTDFPTVTSAGNTGQTSITSVPNDGLTLTVTAMGGLTPPRIAGSTDGNDGFGVAGNSSFDINGNETLTLTFNQDVYINQITFDVFSFDDSTQLDIDSLSVSTEARGNSTFTPSVTGLSTEGNASGPFAINFSGEDFLLSAGETVVIGQGANSSNGILLDGITVTPVPEPGAMSLIVLGGLAMIARRRGSAK